MSVEATAVPAVERELVPGQRWAGGGSETPPVALPDEAGWRCPMCGAMAGAQDLDDDPELPCWDCQQDMRDRFVDYLESM